jgi:hypothetical protein
MKINPTLKQWAKLITLITGLFFLSCKNYYKVAGNPKSKLKTDSTIMANLDRYFILRSGQESFYMSKIEMNRDGQSLNCVLDRLPLDHQLFLNHGRNGKMRYKKNTEDIEVLNEVHLFIPYDSTARAGESYTLDMNKVMKVNVLIKDKDRTTQSYVMGGIGITLGVIAVVSIIIAATKSSCPFVSAYDSNGLSLQGEIYGGAIYPQLARNDYLQLKMAPLPNGNLQVQISNELKERQYTDLAELMVVTHRKDLQMRVDENGNLFSISNPQLPLAAKAGNRDILDLLKTPDDKQVYAFDDTIQQKGNQVELSFNRPADAKNAKLILKLKNSYWLDLVYGKMTQGFGAYYTKFIQKQQSRPVADLKRWTKEQELPMNISLKSVGGWKQVEDITTFGPLANRETVIPLNLDSVIGNTFTVRLNCGFMFWELDYAAVDFSGPADYTLNLLSPKMAVDEAGRDVTALISIADGTYLEQPVPGNATDIEYAYIPNTDSSKTQTFILHAKGYYEHVRNFKGSANVPFLKQFKKPDALSQYSRSLYKDIMYEDLRNLATGTAPATKP